MIEAFTSPTGPNPTWTVCVVVPDSTVTVPDPASVRVIAETGTTMTFVASATVIVAVAVLPAVSEAPGLATVMVTG